MKHVMLFSLSVCLYIGTQCLIILTMHFAHLAQVNVGIITTIWGVQPLVAAVLDYFINSEKLTRYHLCGMIFIVIGGLCVSVSGNGTGAESVTVIINSAGEREEITEALIPKWIPVVFSVMTPMFFIMQGLFTKHATNPKIGFHAQTLSITTSLVGATILVVAAASWYWHVSTPTQYLLTIGFF
mmetsp:Transcript_9676/g.16272  ORF Transcript_9676/g.16272 Transcript_9676/m.16272 type:complete len:184 (+) Transcript_9676:527-1078(+)